MRVLTMGPVVSMLAHAPAAIGYCPSFGTSCHQTAGVRHTKHGVGHTCSIHTDVCWTHERSFRPRRSRKRCGTRLVVSILAHAPAAIGPSFGCHQIAIVRALISAGARQLVVQTEATKKDDLRPL